MATKLDLLIELDSKGAVQGVKALNTEVDKLGSASQVTDKKSGSLFGTITGGVIAANLATKAFSFLGNELGTVFEEALEAEKVQSKLDSTLRANGESVQVVGGLIDDFAGNMEAMTGVTNGEIKSLATLALNLGLNTDQMKAATQGAIGLTTIYGGSLQSNTEAVAKAFQGQWRQIDGMIPEIKNLKTESEKLAVLQKKMTEGFQASTDAMQGTAGALTTAKNQWSNFKEAVGGGLLSVFSGLKKVSDEMTGQAYLARKLRAEHEAMAKAMDASLVALHARGGQTFSEITLGDEASEQKMLEIEKEYAKTKKEIAEIIRKDEVTAMNELQAAREKAAEAAKREMADWTERFGSATGGLTDAGRDLYVQLLQVGGYLPEFTAETQKAAEEQEAMEKSIRSLITAEGELTPVGEGVYIGMLQWAGLIPSVTDALDDNAKSTKKWSIDWDDANSVLEASKQLMSVVKQGLADIGIELGPQAEAFMNAADGATTFIDGLTKGNPLTMIAGGIKVVTSLIKAFAGDGVGEAITRENQWMKLNEQLIKQLKELEKETGSVHEATSIMLDEIINQTDITIDNFGQYAQRIREILSELDRGELTLAETQNEIGDSFEALISKAEELGTTGSNSLLTLFDDLASRGIEVAEITEYINEQMTAGLTGYKAYLEGDFSDATIGVFEDMLAYEKKVGENQALIDGIDGITDALVGMSNASRLNEAEFDSFEKAGRDAYDALIAKGFTEKESLIELAPMLSRLVFLQNEYGLAIDAETQALIDKAKAEGVNLDQYKSQEEIFTDMSDALNQLVEIFRNAFPSAIDATTDAFNRLNGESGKFKPDTTYTGGKGGADVQAASGFYSPRLSQDTLIQAHQGESVVITPKAQNSGAAQGKTVNVSMALNGTITPMSVAEAWLEAYRGNVRGLRSTVEGH